MDALQGREKHDLFFCQAGDACPRQDAEGTVMTSLTLDFRTAQAFYQETLALAKVYCPEWSQYWPPVLDAQQVDQDPGLVLLNLFSQLAEYTALMENRIPEQRRLAFFQFMNMQLRPPVAAQVPLQFTLKSKKPPKAVPAQTAVLDAGNQAIRFQTNQDLLAVPATLSAALTIIPAQDQYIDAMPTLIDPLMAGEPVPLFVASQAVDPAEQPLSHWFMMGDTQLFKPDDSLQNIVITLTGKQLYPEYFGQWFDGALTPLTAQLTGSADALQLQIALTQMPKAGPLTIAQLQQELYDQDDPDAGFDAAPQAQQDAQPEYWLLVKPAPQVRVLASLAQQLPVITGLECRFNGNTIQPQQAAYNVVQLDIPNGAYPFGETPKKDDAFYIRSDSVFGKQGALVTLSFQLTAVERTFPVMLVWQFWDGKQWQPFNQTTVDISRYRFVDTTSNLQHDNPDGPTCIQFECPVIGETTVAGGKGRWIRAVIMEGSYGREGGFITANVDETINAIPADILTVAQKQSVSNYLNNTAGVNFSYQFDRTQYYPPYIQQLQITYSYAAQPSRYWSYNAFQLSRFLFSPFKPVEEVLTGFYFAFAPEEFSVYTVGNKLALYFYLAQEIATPGSKLQWQYYDGAQWQALPVDDGSYGLSRSGVVSFVVPRNMQAAYLFSQAAYWFRINNPHVDRTIRIYGIYPNTVMASNITSVDNEVLGSSNEQPAQTFTLNYLPVLPNLDLQVIEPRGLDVAGDADEAGTGDVFQPWQQVDTFAFSGPTDRVYTLDNQNGLITFGDGYHGMIPPRGYNNIVAVHYDYTQGLAGNVAAGSLTLLRPGIPNIDAVNNPAPAAGGVNGDTVAGINKSSPALIRAGGSAVTLADITALGAAASQQVAQAIAVETDDHRIRIALLALAADPVPYTSPAVLNQVSAYVRQRCLAPLAERIDTSAPDFVAIDVTAQVAASVPADQQHALQQQIAEQLGAFFQPVFGGLDGQGWSFGQTVQASAVSRFLRRIPQVKAVLGLNLNGYQNGDIALLPTQLPIAGQMTVYLYLESP